MENKRILILANHDLVIYNFRKELVKRLISEGYIVYISCPNGERISELESYGCIFIEVKHIDRHGKNPFNELMLLKEYTELIRKIKPLCVLTYTIKPNIFGAISSRKNNTACIANITGLGTAVEKKSMLQKITVGLYKYAFKNINTVFFQNQENMDFFINANISNEKRYKLLPGSGVNLEEFTYQEYPSSEAINFVFISRIMKEKGIDLYLQAATYIKNKYDNVDFHVCGFCEEDYERILEMYEKKGTIKYHGMIKDIKKTIGNMHCTIHPTYYPEGLSNVLLESSAIGRPIITTNRSGCREVVNEGKNGYLVRENDLDSLIDVIEKFLALNNEEREKMGKEGRKFVEQNFSRNIVIEKYLKTIKKIEDEKNEW